MQFLLDHDVPVEIGRILGQAGHRVLRVMDTMPVTAKDTAVFDYACTHDLVLMTCNRDDFLALAAKRQHPGLIVVIRRRTRIGECASVIRLLRKAGSQGIVGNINFA